MFLKSKKEMFKNIIHMLNVYKKLTKMAEEGKQLHSWETCVMFSVEEQ